MSQLQVLSAHVQTLRDWTIEVQSRLTAFAAVGPESGGPGEWPKARYLEQVLQEIGVDGIEWHNAPDPRVAEGTRPNLLAWIRGRGEGPRVWVMAHMDVVPAGDLSKWTADPFTVRVDGDRLYGRGVEDNQHGILAGLLAMKAFRETGIVPAGDFGVVLVADEETGNELGIGHLLAQEGLFRPDDVIVVPDAGNPDGTLVEVAEKSILWLKISTTGKQCHGSTPHLGRNAFVAASRLVVRLRDLYEIFDRKDPVFDPPMSTFEPTKKEANVPNVNTIPGDDTFYVDCRILPDTPVDSVLDQVRAMCAEIAALEDVSFDLEIVQRADAAPATAVDAPVVRALAAAMKAVHGRDIVPIGIGGGTVAAWFRKIGLPAAVWASIDETAHAPDEYTDLPRLLSDGLVLAHVGLHPQG